MIFGVDDDKTIVGVESEKSEAELILETAKITASLRLISV